MLLRVLVGRQKVDGLHVPKVNVMAEEKDKEQLADVFLLLIAIKGLVSFKFGSYVGQLLVDPLDFSLFTFAWKKRDEI